MKGLLKKFFSSINKFDSYVDEYQQRAKVPYIPSKAFMYIGQYWIDNNDYEHAKLEFEKAVSLPVPTPEAYINIGVYHAINKNFDKAITAFKSAIRLDCYCHTAYKLWAGALSEQGDLESALKLIKKANKLSPRDADVLFKWGGLLMKTAQYEAAREKFSKVLFLNPEMYHSYFFLGLIALEEKKYKEAIFNFTRTIDYDVNHVDAIFYLGVTYAKMCENEKALEKCKRTVELSANHYGAYLMIVQLLELLKRPEEALLYFNKIEENNLADVKIYLAWGRFYQNREEYSLAKEKFLKVLQFETDNEEALFSIAFCLFNMDNTEEAIRAAEKVIELYPDNYDAEVLRGRIFTKEKNYQAAIDVYKDLISKTSAHNSLFLELAKCYRMIGNTELSAKYFDKMIEYFPNSYVAYFEYAKLLISIENFQGALRKLRTAYSLNKTSYEVCRLYAIALQECGFKDAAIEKIDMAYELNNSDFQTKVVKIDLLSKINKPSAAMNFVHSVILDSQDAEEAAKLMDLYYKLAQNDNSEYNKDIVRNMCDEIKNKFGEDNSILEKEHNLMSIN